MTFSTNARTPLDLATSVRDARIAAGMSQADLAAAAHLNRSWVSLFEGGHTPNASLSKVLAMLDVLDVTIRLTYTVPDPDSSANEVGRLTKPAPRTVSTPRDDPDHSETSGPAVLDSIALAAALKRRSAHRARAVADELESGAE
ncbi:helix-turn-helix domain-containing protein [Dietzia sp. SLG310A2-38A2]|uniref:helix-turn-helix domain-containing protein n=1 Tax=Dietzia sp. SLG310A2-38A2 TaxID=1630643 RepID=UPI0015FE04A5|nr:helix-turn-helix domain-containing protein [Dietzia sp. SLG310A2-38A2]